MRSTQANFDLLKRRERRLSARLDRYQRRYQARDRDVRTLLRGRTRYLFNLIERLADKRNDISRDLAIMARDLHDIRRGR